MTRFRGLVAKLRARLDAEHVPFVVGGSFALGARGVVRLTQDIDVMVMAPSLEPVHRALRAAGLAWINEVTFRDDESGLLVDVIPVEDEAQRHAFEAATLTALEGAREVRVLTAEGCCLMLLREATRGDAKRRPLRLRDVEALALVGPLEWNEIRDWSRRMGYDQAYRDLRAEGKPASESASR